MSGLQVLGTILGALVLLHLGFRLIDRHTRKRRDQIAGEPQGPLCICGHVRLEHWGKCGYAGCRCARFQRRGSVH